MNAFQNALSQLEKAAVVRATDSALLAQLRIPEREICVSIPVKMDGGDKAEFVRDLTAVAPVCRWSEGHWEFGPGQQQKWNEIQNTHHDIQILANYLLVQYKAKVWNKASSGVGGGTRK